MHRREFNIISLAGLLSALTTKLGIAKEAPQLEKVKLIGDEPVTYELPEGLSFQTFNWDRTYAVLQEGIGGAFENGAGVIDSLDIRTCPTQEAKIEAVRNLLTRNGAKPVAAVG